MARHCPFAHCSTTLVSRRFILRAPLFAVLCALLGVSYSSYAFVSLQAGELPFFWSNSTVSFAIAQSGYAGVNDGSDETAVRRAFEAWDGVSSSRVTCVEDTFNRGRTDWRADDVHLVFWDETNTSGFFPGSAGLVAITPVDFNPNSGEILDADIIFNAKNYTFSTDLQGGTFDIQNVATHEVGHFLGFDHSGVVGATMNPFANTQDTRLRTLELDDIAAAGAIYPMGSQPAAIQGFVRRNGSPVSGAHVVAEDMNGVPASAGLSDGTGFFRIRGLDQGSYAIYAEPLDGPVTSANFSIHTSNLSIDTNFGTTFYGVAGRSSPANPERVFVGFGQTVDVGDIDLRGPANMNISSVTQQAVAPGGVATISVFGSGLDRADTFAVPGPPGDGLIVTGANFTSASATANLDLSSSVVPQLRSIRIYDSISGACAILTGGFEVRMPAPAITGFSTTQAAPGQSVAVTGSEFQAGARAYVGGTEVNLSGSGTQVQFVVPNIPPALCAVTVENPDGQFARVNDVLNVVSGGNNTGNSGNNTGSSGNQAPAPAPAPAPQAAPPPPAPAPAFAGGGGGGGGGGGCTLAAETTPGSLPTGIAFLLVLGALGVARRRS